MSKIIKNIMRTVVMLFGAEVLTFSALATIKPDDKDGCPISPGVSNEVSLTRVMVGQNLNVKFGEEAGYCLNKYFSSPGGQVLNYTLLLCDQAWNPIPGWTIDHNWIHKFRTPAYISFTPKDMGDMGEHRFIINATNGTASVLDKIKISVYQFNDRIEDPIAEWNVWPARIQTLVASVVPHILSAWKVRDELRKGIPGIVQKHPLPLGLAVGLSSGLGFGWLAQSINLQSRKNPKEAQEDWWKCMLGCVLPLSLFSPIVFKKYLVPAMGDTGCIGKHLAYEQVPQA
ncbi:MAG: hypothetical protein I8H72_04700 [Myxococcaceae bacterium]|nr:hypothetical protein [Myxococcaceae bacterium]